MGQSILGQLLAIAMIMVAGCHKPYVMTRLDYVAYNEVSGAYDHSLDHEFVDLAKLRPPTVREPAESEVWELSLEDAIQIGLENNKRIRFLGYIPAEVGTAVEGELAAFDPTFEVGSAWRQLRSPITQLLTVPTSVELFGGGAGFGTNSTAGGITQSGFSSIPGGNTIGVAKRNAAGGLTSLNLTTDFSNQFPTNPFDLFDPLWNTRLTIALEQPLLQGAGVEFNRSLILIARSGHEQAKSDFEVTVRVLLRDIERAYWDMHFAYNNLYSREVGMQLALSLWQAEQAKLEEGAGSKPDVAQAREQYESFRDARLQSLDQVLAVESALRELLGVPPHDQRRIIPADDPTIAQFVADWEPSIFEALHLRPELVIQRLAIRSAQLELERQKNGLRPDLSVIARYSRLGAENSFDESVERLSTDEFEDWTLGVRLRVRLGERAAHAAVRRAELALMRERATLKNLENTILFELQRAYRSINTQYESLQVRQSRKQAASDFLDSQLEFFQQGKTTIFVVLEAQSRFTDALRDEALAISQYNQALIDWEFAKGTILTNDNLEIAEGESLPLNLKLLRRRQRRSRRSIAVPIPVGQSVHRNDDYLCLDPNSERVEPLYTPESYQQYGVETPSTSADQTMPEQDRSGSPETSAAVATTTLGNSQKIKYQPEA